MSIKNTLRSIIIKSIKDNNYDIDNHRIVVKKDKKNGNYLSDVAIIISDIIKKSSQEIAEKIKESIDDSIILEKIVITEAGYLLLIINKEYLLANINNIIEKKEKYGKCNIGQDKKINIEYISDNILNKVTLEDIRATIYIDNIARLMTNCGYKVIKELYINKDQETKEEIINLKDYLDKYRIYFEKYPTQKSLYDNDIIEDILTKIKYTPDCYINDDSLWIKTTNYGLEKDIKLVDKDGNLTEIVQYLAYLYNIENNNYDSIINVSTPNIIQYIDYITIILNYLKKISNITIINNQGDINIVTNNSNQNRKLDNIDINTIRFYLSCYNLDTNMNLNIDLMQNLTNDNPISYIEKNYNRLLSIIKKNKKNLKAVDKYTTINNDLTYNILEKINIFEDIIIEACSKKRPNLITNYIYELTSLTNQYFENELFDTADDIHKNERLNLLLAVKIVLNNSLNLIGIIPREEI